ncbi:MAG: cellulase family glycosylhydrolase [Fimbriimonadaceae bacterium]
MLTAMLATIAGGATGWFGPAEATLNVRFPGNPWDPEQNDVRVRFSGPDGVREERLAFFDGRSWRVRLVAKVSGRYVGEVWRNGSKAEAGSVVLTLDRSLPKGFVRRGGPWGFRYDDGTLYWPIGFNLGWQSPGLPDMAETLAEMGRIGLDWSRIWACHWDGKNPWWPNDGSVKLETGELWPKALDRWDQLVAAAEKAGVRFQMVLFHHGQWSTRTNPNWSENPWNKANGGFLERPHDFFTDPRAKKLAKAWLRYAVARYGHSPAVLAWELFNEVEWVDAVADGQKEEVGRWMDEMADYLRSIDPYGHLVTTSSHLDLPISRRADYYQPHGYPPSVAAMVLAAPRPGDKPLFFGEVGPGDLGGSREIQVEAVRGGIWSALFAQQAGAGQYWTWDRVYRDSLLPEFRRATEIVRGSGVLTQTGLSLLRPDFGTGSGGDLSLRPGAGWEPTRQFDYVLPRQAGDMGRFSSYFQGRAHREMRPEPIRLRFEADKPGEIRIRTIGLSSSGGDLTVEVNGSLAARRSYRQRSDLSEPLVARFPAGKVEVVLDNDGPDWVQIGSIVLTGIAERASAVGIGNDRLAVVRVQRNDSGSGSLTLRLPRLVRGVEADVECYDLDAGRRLTVWLAQPGGVLPWDGRDAIVVVRARQLE